MLLLVHVEGSFAPGGTRSDVLRLVSAVGGGPLCSSPCA